MSGVREWYQQCFSKKNRKYFSVGVFSKIVILYAKRNKSGWQNEVFLSALLYQSFPRVPTLPPPPQGDSNEDVGRLTFSSF